MTARTALALAAALAAAPASAQEWDGCHVLTVGVNKYKHPAVSDLRGAANDAERVAAFFRDRKAAGVRTLTDERATGAAVSDELDRLGRTARRGDPVVIFLAGHGTREAGRATFLCHDFDPKRPDMVEYALGRTVDALVAGGCRVLLAADFCHAGQLADRFFGLDARGVAGRKDVAGGLVLLASCVPGQLTLEGGTNGLFTATLLEALGGDADVNTDGVVTLAEVKAYLFWRMREGVRRFPKLPGMEWPEQDQLCLWTPTVPESFAVSRVPGARPRKPGQEKYEGAPLNFDWPGKTATEVGTWVAATPVTRADGTAVLDRAGKPRRTVYTLEFRADETFAATFDDGSGEVRVTRGRYGRGSWGCSPSPGVWTKTTDTLDLAYGTGRDFLEVVRLDKDELTFWVALARGQKPAKFTLARQK